MVWGFPCVEWLDRTTSSDSTPSMWALDRLLPADLRGAAPPVISLDAMGSGSEGIFAGMTLDGALVAVSGDFNVAFTYSQ